MKDQTNHPKAADAHKAHEIAPLHADHQPPKHADGHAAKEKPGVAEVNPLEKSWKEISAKMMEKWSALTADDLRFVDKTRVALIAKVHERTGLDVDTAERQLDALIGTSRLNSA